MSLASNCLVFLSMVSTTPTHSTAVDIYNFIAMAFIKLQIRRMSLRKLLANPISAEIFNHGWTEQDKNIK